MSLLDGERPSGSESFAQAWLEHRLEAGADRVHRQSYVGLEYLEWTPLRIHLSAVAMRSVHPASGLLVCFPLRCDYFPCHPPWRARC